MDNDPGMYRNLVDSTNIYGNLAVYLAVIDLEAHLICKALMRTR